MYYTSEDASNTNMHMNFLFTRREEYTNYHKIPYSVHLFFGLKAAQKKPGVACHSNILAGYNGERHQCHSQDKALTSRQVGLMQSQIIVSNKKEHMWLPHNQTRIMGCITGEFTMGRELWKTVSKEGSCLPYESNASGLATTHSI